MITVSCKCTLVSAKIGTAKLQSLHASVGLRHFFDKQKDYSEATRVCIKLHVELDLRCSPSSLEFATQSLEVGQLLLLLFTQKFHKWYVSTSCVLAFLVMVALAVNMGYVLASRSSWWK